MSTLHLGIACGINRMIIAYHWPQHLSNFECLQKLEHTNGPPVLAYLWLNSEGHFELQAKFPLGSPWVPHDSDWFTNADSNLPALCLVLFELLPTIL
jgi:hypothetical protein